MKKLLITAACIATVLSSFANNTTGKTKMSKENVQTMNAVVFATGTKITVTAISDYPKGITVHIKDEKGDDLYEGNLVKSEYSQSAIFNLDALGEGNYTIILQNGKESCEKKIAVNTTKQVAVE